MKIFEMISSLFEESFLFERLDPAKKQEYLARNMTQKILAAAQKDQSLKIVDGVGRNTQEQADFALNVVKQLTQADPSDGYDFINFIVRMYCASQFKIEDLPKIREELTLFAKVKNKLQNKDINSYQSLDQLYDATDALKGEADQVSGKAEVKAVKANAKKVIDTPNFKVIIPETHEAACFYGANTKWCTASKDDPDTFENYAKDGPLYVIIAKNPKSGKDVKYQMHYESDQFMNERDQQVKKTDIDFLSSFPQYKEFLEALIKKHYNIS
jgi:hypothetical protein